ncbi:unnamed protein product [Mytilus coruscus]|uniref:SWIM-type domain-containing protein n=1 Tax=Mytilus coruscus TaxID=42192 RepID=A0A6J7ZYK7_MYTCO|nr:unnamed protein product [Mytilus coruscus]
MECPSENKQFLSVFFSNLKEAVKEKFEDEEFDPTGIICDEASCNWQAMQEIFRRDLVERSKSCDFHYNQSINRTKGKITTGDDDKEIFKTLATDLMEAITSPQYEKTKDALQMFIGTNENLTFLNNWLTWWNKRRAHWCYAFRPDHFAPGANLAEEERIEVGLQQVPNCSCPFKTKNPSKICMHIVFALLRYFDVDENSMLLHQLAYTKSEFNKLKNSLVEIRTNNESLEQSWILSRKEKLPGKIPNCSGCKAKSIMPGDLHIYVKGKIVLKNNIQKDVTFRFCPDSKCLKNILTWSNLKPFTCAFVDF